MSEANDNVSVRVQDDSVPVDKVQLIHDELEPRVTKARPGEVLQIANAIVSECRLLGVDPLFVLAIIEVESNFDIEAVSPTGARGLMQIMPRTFRAMSDAQRMFDPVENVKAGIRYIRHLYDGGFGRRGGPESVLLAYNQGPGTALAVLRGQIKRPAEARTYVPRVMAKYRTLLSRNGYSPKDAKRLFLAVR